MKTLWLDQNGIKYYIEKKFAWFPCYGQGTFIWLRWYWSQTTDATPAGIYDIVYPYDPRQK